MCWMESEDQHITFDTYSWQNSITNHKFIAQLNKLLLLAMSKAGYHMMIIDSNEMMKMLVEIEIWYMHKMYIKDNIQWAICNLE